MNHQNTQAPKVALVTGAARRIGACIAKKLHSAGFSVAIHCFQSLPEAQALAHDFNQLRPGSADIMQADLQSPKVSEALIQAVIARFGHLDVLINNASLFIRDTASGFNVKDWQDLFKLNVQAPLELSLTAYPFLVKQQGVIINITDIHGEKPLKGYTSYCQSKAALAMQTKALANDFAPDVRVNAIAPGAIIWPEHTNALGMTIKDAIIAKTPLKMHGDPEYIAQAVLALIENPFITGQTLAVDGGRSINQ